MLHSIFYKHPQMRNFFIEPQWLSAVAGTRFYYPAAYLDHTEALEAFQDVIDEFWFADLHYGRGLRLDPALAGHPEFILLNAERSGVINAQLERRSGPSGRSYRFLEPSRLIERYERPDGRQLTVVRRRGFGQIGLMEEFPERGLGIFMHRGDSDGEGGSGVWFLANKKSSYGPCGMLFDKLASRLSDESLIVSDGSNSKINQLRTFLSKDVSGEAAFKHHQG